MQSIFFNVQLARLRITLDVETTYNSEISNLEVPADVATTELNSKSPTSDVARKAFLAGQSEERVQALSVVMLYLCSGLQHAQGVATYWWDDRTIQLPVDEYYPMQI